MWFIVLLGRHRKVCSKLSTLGYTWERDSEEVWFAQDMPQDSKRGSLCFSFLICEVGLMVTSPIMCLACLAQSNVSIKFTCCDLRPNENGGILGKCYCSVMLHTVFVERWSPSSPETYRLRMSKVMIHFPQPRDLVAGAGIMVKKVEGVPSFMEQTAQRREETKQTIQ